ncbi:MAG: HEAT repeat domain-containing protein [Planctomycetota bacterium]
MLGWLFPRSPIDPLEKAWIETRMLWLARKRGMHQGLDTQVLLPVADIVPDDYDGTLEKAGAILARMCESLKLSADEFELELSKGSERNELPADGPRNIIRLGADLMSNPYAVAAATARGLAVRQFSVQTLAGSAPSRMGWLVDLAAVCLGWGAVISHQWAEDAARKPSCGRGSGGCDQPRDVLPARMLGYALALFVHGRGEKRLGRRHAVQEDAFVVCNRSLRYLHRTGDTLLTVDRVRREPGDRTTEELSRQLNAGSASARIAALWELRDPDRAREAMEPVSRCLHHRLPAIREEAAKTISLYGPAAQDALPLLMDLLYDSRYSIRAAAAAAVGTLGNYSAETLAHVASLLRDSNPYVVYHAAMAIRNFGAAAEDAIPDVFAALRAAVIRCDHELIDALVRTLYTLDQDPTERVMAYFDDDPELCQQVAHIINETLTEE